MSSPKLALIHPDSPVKSIMRTPVASVAEGTSLTELAEVLADNEIGAVAVVRYDRMLGVVSERDVVARVAAGVSMDETTVDEVMSTDLLTVQPDETIISAAQRANAALVRHLPVLGPDGEVVGFISIRDLMTVLVAAVAPG